MSLLLPEVQLLKILSYLITHLRNDYDDKVTDDLEEESLIYRMWNGVSHNNFNYYTQAKELFLRKDNDPKRLGVRVFFDSTRAGFPTIHIVMPGESLSQEFIGYGDEEDHMAQQFKTRYSLIITSSNYSEVLIIYYTVRSLLMAGIATLDNYGITLPKNNGGDLTLNEEIAPKGVFYRAIFLDCEYQEFAPNIEELPDMKTIDFSGTAIELETVIPPEPEPAPGFQHNDFEGRDEEGAHPASAILSEDLKTVQEKIDIYDGHISDKNNPHETTAEQVGADIAGSAATAEQNAKDYADQITPTKTSQLINDSNFPVDANYVHTDNNYTTAEKNKLAGLVNGINIHGEIRVNTDFPLLANVVSGDAYVIKAVPVTDDAGVLYTNTGLTFDTIDEIIVWSVNGGWVTLGSGNVISVNGKSGVVSLEKEDIPGIKLADSPENANIQITLLKSIASGGEIDNTQAAWLGATDKSSKSWFNKLLDKIFKVNFPQPLVKSGTFTLALTDLEQFIQVDSAVDCLCNIPANVDVSFNIGSILIIEQFGVGVITVTALSGVTLSGDPKTQGQTKCIALYKYAINTWLVIGGTA